MAIYQIIKIAELTLDIENPRIARLIEKFGQHPSEEQMFLALHGGAPESEQSGVSFQSLRESIRTNGGIFNPIMVNKTIDGKYIVIEGNTRVAIYKDFKRKQVPGEWDDIPAIVYDGLNQVGIDAIRLQAHLVGPRAWDPYSKAKYLHFLRNSQHLTMQQLVDFCGGREHEIKNYIAAFEDMEAYYRPILSDSSDFDPTRFSSFIEVQRSTVKMALADNNFTLEDFAKWVNDRLIDPQITVRDLPRILKHPEARKKFIDEGAREALKLIHVPSTQNLGNVSNEDIIKETIYRIQKLGFTDIRYMKSNPDAELSRLFFELLGEVQDTCEWIQGND